jgi:hypothetical protein
MHFCIISTHTCTHDVIKNSVERDILCFDLKLIINIVFSAHFFKFYGHFSTYFYVAVIVLLYLMLIETKVFCTQVKST